MRIILPVVFVLCSFCGVFALVMVNESQNGKPSTRASTSGESPFAFALQFLTEDIVAATVPEEPVGALVAYLPAAPAGWTRTAYQTADGEALTESVYQSSAVVVSGNNSIMSVFASASNDINGAAVTYRTGEEVVAIALSARSSREMRSLRGSIMTAIGGNLSGASFGASKEPFATLHGVKFEQGGQFSRVVATNANVPINYRKFTASMGGQLSMTIMTNASDATLATVLRGIDVPGLNETLVTPDLTVTAGTGLITRERGTLSTSPPPPTLPYKAYNRLRSGVEGLKEDDVRQLQAMADQRITGWEDVYEEYGMRHRLSPAIIEVLGPEPELPPVLKVKYTATEMLRGSQWTAYERDILQILSRGSITTQSQAQRRLERGRLYAPPVMRLIMELPVEQDVAAVDGDVTEAVKEVVIRRGVEVQQGTSLAGDCTIELGTRRCIVDGNTD